MSRNLDAKQERMSFSERMGITEPRTLVQKDEIDGPLRNKLWDILREGFLEQKINHLSDTPHGETYARIWIDLFEEPGDEVPRWVPDANSELKAIVLEHAWFEVYDLLEFVFTECRPTWVPLDKLIASLNATLTKYLSAYRFIGEQFVEISDPAQMSQVETALSSPLAGVRTHIAKALGLLSDRDSPDVENSIKESVSAVESICSAILGRKATLGDALGKLNDVGLDLHPALIKGWRSIYGYTSDEHGIRHAMQDQTDLKVADALYFVVSCSAFVTLLTQHANDLGIELKPAS